MDVVFTHDYEYYHFQTTEEFAFISVTMFFSIIELGVVINNDHFTTTPN